MLKDYNYNDFPIPHERTLYNWYCNGKIDKYSVRYKRKRNNSSYGKTTMSKDILKNSVHQRTVKYNFGIHDYSYEHRHFEIDLVEGSNHKLHLLTVVDRNTLFTLVYKVKSKAIADVDKKIRIAIRKLLKKGISVKTISSDNGSEFTYFKEIESFFDIN